MSKVKAKQIWADIEWSNADTKAEYRVVRVRNHSDKNWNGSILLYPAGGDRRQVHAQMEKDFEDYFMLVSED